MQKTAFLRSFFFLLHTNVQSFPLLPPLSDGLHAKRPHFGRSAASASRRRFGHFLPLAAPRRTLPTVAALRFPLLVRSRQSCRFLETGSLYLPPAALRRSLPTVAALRFPLLVPSRQSCRFLETGSLYLPPAALRRFPEQLGQKPPCISARQHGKDDFKVIMSTYQLTLLFLLLCCCCFGEKPGGAR